MARLVFLLFCAFPSGAFAGDVLRECTMVLRHLANDRATRAPYVKAVVDSGFVYWPGSSVVLPTSKIFVPQMQGPFVEQVVRHGFYMPDPGRWLVLEQPPETSTTSPALRDFHSALSGFVAGTLIDAGMSDVEGFRPRLGLFSVSDPNRPLQRDFHDHEVFGDSRLPGYSLSLNAEGTETQDRITPRGDLLLFDNFTPHRTPGTISPVIRRSFIHGDFGK